MSIFLIVFIWVILMLSFLVIVIEFLQGNRDKKLFLFLCVLFLFLFVIFNYMDFPERIEYKGGTSEVSLIIFLYVAVLAGMVAQYFYHRKNKKISFEIWNFIKPFLVSPMVFLPVLQVLQRSDFSGVNNTLSFITLFIIAFQNGFFWRSIFEEQ